MPMANSIPPMPHRPCLPLNIKRTTGEKKYFDLMKYFLETRGQPDNDEAQIFLAAHYAQHFTTDL